MRNFKSHFTKHLSKVNLRRTTKLTGRCRKICHGEPVDDVILSQDRLDFPVGSDVGSQLLRKQLIDSSDNTER